MIGYIRSWISIYNFTDYGGLTLAGSRVSTQLHTYSPRGRMGERIGREKAENLWVEILGES